MRLTIPARLLFIGTWNHADDGGVMPASVCKLKMLIYPSDPFTIHEVGLMVDEMLTEGLLQSFEEDGKEYWRITGWHHQVITYPSYRFPRSREYGEEAKEKRIKLASSSVNPQRTFSEASDTIGSGEKRSGEKRREEKLNTRSIDATPEMIFDFASESDDRKCRILEKAKAIHRRIWPNSLKLKEQDRQEIVIACYLAEVQLSADWLEAAIEKTVQKRADKPGAYFRTCLTQGAETLKYDYHNLITHVRLPQKKPKEETPS